MENLETRDENTDGISIISKTAKSTAKIKTNKNEKRKTKDIKIQASGKKKNKHIEETIIEKESDIRTSDGDKYEKKKAKRKPKEEVKDNDKEEGTNDQPKSKKKKKKKKQLSNSTTENAEDDKTVENKAKILAIQYLQQWKKFRSVWSFQKVRQVWLLRNMYDADMVDDENFEILLEYLGPLRGLAKTTTIQKAEQLLKDQEQSDSSDSEDENKPEKEEADIVKRVKLTDTQVDRVRQVIQILV